MKCLLSSGMLNMHKQICFKTIFEYIFFRYEEAVSKQMFRSMKSSFKRWKKTAKLPVFKSLEEMGNYFMENPMHDSYCTLTTRILPVEGYAEPVVAIFNSKLILELKKANFLSSQLVHADCTFNIVPKSLFNNSENKCHQFLTLQTNIEGQVSMIYTNKYFKAI